VRGKNKLLTVLFMERLHMEKVFQKICRNIKDEDNWWHFLRICITSKTGIKTLDVNEPIEVL
jgi:hypothetical protein